METTVKLLIMQEKDQTLEKRFNPVNQLLSHNSKLFEFQLQ